MTVNGADDVLLVHGGTPLEGEIRVRGAKNLVPKAMVAALLGSAEAGCATCRTSATCGSYADCCNCTG